MKEKVAIIGSRDWRDLAAVRNYVQGLPEGTLLISGGARGVDQEAERTWMGCHGTVRTIKPDYNEFGRKAPLVRNHQIVQEADRIVAFWDGDSPGTKHVIDYALRERKQIEVRFA